MISVVIPTLNAEDRLPLCLNALMQPAADGLVKEVIVVDGGSNDRTLDLADAAGARILSTTRGRGGQLKAGAAAASGEWLLFLHADTVLEAGWADEASGFIRKEAHAAAVFTLSFDARGIAPRLVAFGAMQRTRLTNMPYGDQGLLLSKLNYDEIGGFADIPLFEDVEIIKRLIKAFGPRALHVFFSKAITSARRYEEEGYLKRIVKNFILLTRYQLGAAPEDLARRYH